MRTSRAWLAAVCVVLAVPAASQAPAPDMAPASSLDAVPAQPREAVEAALKTADAELTQVAASIRMLGAGGTPEMMELLGAICRSVAAKSEEPCLRLQGPRLSDCREGYMNLRALQDYAGRSSGFAATCAAWAGVPEIKALLAPNGAAALCQALGSYAANAAATCAAARAAFVDAKAAQDCPALVTEFFGDVNCEAYEDPMRTVCAAAAYLRPLGRGRVCGLPLCQVAAGFPGVVCDAYPAVGSVPKGAVGEAALSPQARTLYGRLTAVVAMLEKAAPGPFVDPALARGVDQRLDRAAELMVDLEPNVKGKAPASSPSPRR